MQCQLYIAILFNFVNRMCQLTLKSDLYSFGVVPLEIITGRKAINDLKAARSKILLNGQARLWFTDERRFTQIVDPELQGKYPPRGLFQVHVVAAMCVEEQPDMGPVIVDVITSLNYLAAQKYDGTSHACRLWKLF